MRLEECCNYGSKETPKVGDKCTIHFFSDSHPAQVIRVSKSGKTMWIRENYVEADKSKKLEFGHQEWIIYENSFEGCEQRVTLRKNGVWRTSKSNCYVALGQWYYYYDYSF